MSSLPILLFVVFAALIIVGAYYSHQQKLQRQSALAALAAERGWQFDQSPDHSHDEQYSFFSIFKSGDNRYAYNTFRGSMPVAEAAWPIQLGDYHYETTSTSTDSKGHTTTSTHHHHFSYLLVETPYLGAPDLFVRAEGFFDSLAGFFGFNDIDFESKEFSDRFVVKSSDKRFAFDVFHPRMMEFMLAGRPPTIEFRRAICCFSTGKTWDAEGFVANLDWATEFLAHWPRHLTSTLMAPK